MEYSQACIYHCALESEIPAFSSETEGREVASCKKNRQLSQAQPPISFFTTSDILSVFKPVFTMILKLKDMYGGDSKDIIKTNTYTRR